MHIELKPQIEALLQAQVEIGKFASIEDAVTAAVLGLPLADAHAAGLEWARPLLDEADRAIAAGDLMDEATAFSEIEQRLGKI